jgi:uncharacterized integral membrane protein
MSAAQGEHSPSQAEHPKPAKPSKAARRERARAGAMVILAVLITLFAVLNVNEVNVNWIFGSGKAPLIIVIILSLLVGIVITYVADRRARRR